MKNDPRSSERNLCNCVRGPVKKKKFRTSTGFERCSNQLSYEATDVGSCQLCVHMFHWKKNALYLSVNVFSTKVLVGDTIFTSLTGDGTAILRGQPSYARV